MSGTRLVFRQDEREGAPSVYWGVLHDSRAAPPFNSGLKGHVITGGILVKSSGWYAPT